MAKSLKIILLTLLALVVICAGVFCCIYWSRFQTLGSIDKLTDYDDGFNVYRMNVAYDYDLDAIVARGITDDQSALDAVIQEALPLLPVSVKVPSFGCTAFTLKDTDGDVHMGRNYDFSLNTSAMVVYCQPKNGYKSVALAALDNLGANDPNSGLKAKMASLAAPFVCLDGMNEKGVSIAVLTLDSQPVRQDNGKPDISTTMGIRLVLDRAATTQEAVDLLDSYDMKALAGRDYHLYITDASGDGRIIEYDCEDESRPMVATKTDIITNFFYIYKDKVLPNQKNGIYGHGRERFDAVEQVFAAETQPSVETVWTALRAASQEPKPNDITSNTQWSLNYNNTDLTLEIVLRRHWEDTLAYDLNTNQF